MLVTSSHTISQKRMQLKSKLDAQTGQVDGMNNDYLSDLQSWLFPGFWK